MNSVKNKEKDCDYLTKMQENTNLKSTMQPNNIFVFAYNGSSSDVML